MWFATSDGVSKIAFQLTFTFILIEQSKAYLLIYKEEDSWLRFL